MNKKNSNKFKTAEAIMLLILFVIAIISIFYRHNRQQAPNDFETYIVQQGDSLWKIAERYPSIDPREIVYAIEKENNISPSIVPGQEINIPVYMGDE